MSSQMPEPLIGESELTFRVDSGGPAAPRSSSENGLAIGISGRSWRTLGAVCALVAGTWAVAQRFNAHEQKLDAAIVQIGQMQRQLCRISLAIHVDAGSDCDPPGRRR